MKAGFERVDGEFKAVRMETKEEFAKVRAEMKDGFDKLNRTLFGFGGSLLVTLVVFVFTH